MKYINPRKYDEDRKIRKLFRRELRLRERAWEADDEAAGHGAEIWEAEQRGEAASAEEVEAAHKAEHAAEAANVAHMATVWALFWALIGKEGGQ